MSSLNKMEISTNHLIMDSTIKQEQKRMNKSSRPIFYEVSFRVKSPQLLGPCDHE